MAAVAAAGADELHLRCGGSVVGRIVAENDAAYRVQLAVEKGPAVTNVGRRSVRYVIYDSPRAARAALKIADVARALGARHEARAAILPTDPFGPALLDAVRNAKERVWITAYYISGSTDPMIKSLYDELRAKARAGVDVRILAEDSRRTPPSIRRASINFAETLRESGIKVSYMRDKRVLHKKIVLIDREKSVLGSSNLTSAGLSYSDEANALIESEAFAREVERDFKELEKSASQGVK